MASLISMSQAPVSLQSTNSLSSSKNMITFGRKQVKHKSNKVTPQDLDVATSNINECGLPSYTSPTHENANQNIYANSKLVKEPIKDKSTPIDAFNNGSDRLQEQLKTNILHGGNKRLEWPRGSIPRTVKKLSWDDEHITSDDVKNNVINPDVSLTPMEPSHLRGDVVNLDTIVA